jgi:two-component system LytT family sensor kinase
LWVILFRSYSVALSKTMTIEFCYLIFITVDYYLISDLVVPQFLFKRKYTLFVIATLLTIAVSAFIRALLARYMNLHFFKTVQTLDIGTLYFNSFLNISLWVLIITICKMMVDRIQTQTQVDMLEQERVKNELDYLKAQINPHALFNSLNTIYGHIDKSNQVARNILLQFSGILRYQLYDCSAEKVALEKEIEFVKNYIDFQRLRKDETLLVSLTIGQIDRGLQIAPLLLVVLIENAFKFAGNKILISLHTEGQVLHGYFYNTKEAVQSFPAGKESGIGLVNLKRRLELLYAEKYKLVSHAEKDFYETHLTINLS